MAAVQWPGVDSLGVVLVQTASPETIPVPDFHNAIWVGLEPRQKFAIMKLLMFLRRSSGLAGGDIMLQNLSLEVRECLRHAEDCAQRAKIEPHPTVQLDFFDMERRWLKLARSYQYLEQMSSFTAHNQQLRASLSERLKQLLDDQIGAQAARAGGSPMSGECPSSSTDARR